MIPMDSPTCFAWRPAALVILFALAGFADPPTIAVNDLSPRGVQASDAAIVSERLRSELVRGGAFRVMDRGQMDVVLREQAFQQSGACDQSECAVQMGKLLSVDQMVVGSVGKLGSLYTLSAQLLDVETGAIALSVNQDFQGPVEDLLSQAVPLIAAKLVAGHQGAQAGATTADLYVTSRPEGGAIELDGQLRPETTPATLQGIPAGVHRIRIATLSHAGQGEVALTGGELRRLDVDLAPGKGNLKIVTRPPGARAFLDGRFLAETPFKRDIPAGAHQVELRLPGRVPALESLVVRPDAAVERTIDLPTGQILSLRADFPGVSALALDGTRSHRFAADGTDAWLADGAWTLRVEDPRFAPWESGLAVGGPGRREIRIPLVPVGAFADSLDRFASARRRRHGAGWFTAFLSVAAFGTAGYFHYDAIRASDRADDASRAYDQAIYGDDMAKLRKDHSSAVKHANSSLVEAWISDGIGGALLVTSIVCWSF